MQVLICASTASHINNFHLPYLRFFKDQGMEVHVAVPEPERVKEADRLHAIPMSKHILSLKNISAIWKLRRIIRENEFELILTHTALAGFVGRVAVLLAGRHSARVIHTVHGYLFWNGCGLLRKIAYYLPERLLRGVTDCVVTMNEEDSVTAQKMVIRGGLVAKVSGMGVDACRFVPASEKEKQMVRRELSIPDEAFVLVYAAEFSKRKNHSELLSAMTEITKAVPNALLLLFGTGSLRDKIETEARRLNLLGNVRFMGWCDQMQQSYKACDLAVSTSRSEGLPFNIVEAQMCALPVVASKIRGHTDLIKDGINGRLYTPGDSNALAKTVIEIYKSPDCGQNLGAAARRSAKGYSLEVAFAENTAVYKEIVRK